MLLVFISFEGSHAALLADSKIPAGQDVGSREQQFQLQKRQEAVKKRLMQRRKKSKIKNAQNKKASQSSEGDTVHDDTA